MNRFTAILTAIGLLASAPALAESPGQEAIQEFRESKRRPGAIENRFFLKQNRFEVTPFFGYVPNNPFVVRYAGGATLAYHFSEQFAAEGMFYYSPDLGLRDLKGLTNTLTYIAAQSGGDFQQPLDKKTLGASFGARWAPLYGKINLIGESVVNFDFYGTAGLGIISKTNYYAVLHPDQNPDSVDPSLPITALEATGNEVKITPTVGAGADFFLTQSIALKLDARIALYVDDMPDYQPNEANPTDGMPRLYNNFVTSAGVAMFFPKMKPRMENF